MNSAFNKLSAEKREMIINIALEEFASNGYDNTSTDVITTRAGISKGILFHYFRSKKNLYFFIIDHAINLLSEKTLQEFEKICSQDFFERMKELVIIKQRLSMIYKNETKLILGMMVNTSPAIKREIDELSAKVAANSRRFQNEMIGGMVIPKLKKNITVERAIEITQGLFTQLTNKYVTLYGANTEKFNDITEKMIKELDEYCEIIKYGIYED